VLDVNQQIYLKWESGRHHLWRQTQRMSFFEKVIQSWEMENKWLLKIFRKNIALNIIKCLISMANFVSCFFWWRAQIDLITFLSIDPWPSRWSPTQVTWPPSSPQPLPAQKTSKGKKVYWMGVPFLYESIQLRNDDDELEKMKKSCKDKLDSKSCSLD